MKIKNRYAFTLLEVMIFIMILSMVLVTSTSFVTKLLMNIRTNEHRTSALFLADDVKEWLSGEREANTWATFLQRSAVNPGRRFCLNNPLDLDTLYTELGGPVGSTYPDGACTTDASIQVGMPAIYRRELLLVSNAAVPATQVSGTITVSWVDNGNPKQVIVRTIHTSPF